MITGLLLAAAVTTVSPLVVTAPPLSNPLVADGRALVEKHCVGCHSAEPAGYSIYSAAPPFRWMKTLRPDILQLVAADVRRGDHAGMPQIILTKSESEAISAYIRAYANADASTQKAMSVHACFARTC